MRSKQLTRSSYLHEGKDRVLVVIMPQEVKEFRKLSKVQLAADIGGGLRSRYEGPQDLQFSLVPD